MSYYLYFMVEKIETQRKYVIHPESKSLEPGRARIRTHAVKIHSLCFYTASYEKSAMELNQYDGAKRRAEDLQNKNRTKLDQQSLLENLNLSAKNSF